MTRAGRGRERRTASALLKQISEAGYDGGYSRLADFIREWRAQQGGVALGKAFVPLAFEFGEASNSIGAKRGW